MTDREVRDLGRKLLDEHGLADWRFTLNPRPVRRAGCCHYPPMFSHDANPAGRIEVSSKFSRENDEFHVKDVILHEIAHAKTGRIRPAHGAKFAAAARAIGCRSTGSCTIPTAKSAKGKYRGICPDPDCDGETYRSRLPRNGRRNSCGSPSHGGGGFKPEFELKWVLTEDYDIEAPRHKTATDPLGDRVAAQWMKDARYLPTPDDPLGIDPNAGAPKKKRPRLAPVVKGHAVGEEVRVASGWRIICQCGCDWWRKKKLDGIKAHRRHKKEVQAHGN